MEKFTECECSPIGFPFWCKRHKCEKTERDYHRCAKSPSNFVLCEQGISPVQNRAKRFNKEHQYDMSYDLPLPKCNHRDGAGLSAKEFECSCDNVEENQVSINQCYQCPFSLPRTTRGQVNKERLKEELKKRYNVIAIMLYNMILIKVRGGAINTIAGKQTKRSNYVKLILNILPNGQMAKGRDKRI